jgi:hypothetical protein
MRRDVARVVGAALLGAVVALAAAPAAAQPCEDSLGRAATGRAASARYLVVFAAIPAPITVGRTFSIDAVVCERRGSAEPTGLWVDATMPEHRHGMNYRPSISPNGYRRFIADGLLFHMPGRWQLVFEVESSSGTERATADLTIE